MGLEDRDYYRDDLRQRQQQQRGGATGRPLRSRSPMRSRSWRIPAWLLWIVLLIAAAIAAKAWQEWKRTEPFPMTGQVQWFTDTSQRPTARLTLQAPPTGAVNFAVRFDDWETHAPVAMVPVRAGETAEIQMPLARYRMTIHKGTAWQGSNRLFAFGSDSREAVYPVELYRVGNTIMGHRIQLETIGGNMETKPGRRF